MSEKSEQTKEVLERFHKHGIDPDIKYPTIYDAVIALLDAADKALAIGERNGMERIAELEAQNKRYREALEAIANNDFGVWEMPGVAKQALDDKEDV